MPEPKLILLVDDDPDCLEVSRLTLEGAGYRVRCSFDTEQAMSQVLEQAPDLIVSDLMMRSLDEGFGFVKKLRDRPSAAHIPVILTTGIQRQMGGITFRPRSAEERAALGIDAYLEKPVRGTVLLAKVRELVGDPV